MLFCGECNAVKPLFNFLKTKMCWNVNGGKCVNSFFLLSFITDLNQNNITVDCWQWQAAQGPLTLKTIHHCRVAVCRWFISSAELGHSLPQNKIEYNFPSLDCPVPPSGAVQQCSCLSSVTTERQRNLTVIEDDLSAWRFALKWNTLFYTSVRSLSAFTTFLL